MSDVFGPAQVLTARLSIPAPDLFSTVLRAEGGQTATDMRRLVNVVVHQTVTSLWQNKWRQTFERRWYDLVTRRTGLSGTGFILTRGRLGSLSGGINPIAGEFVYRIRNAADYAEHVHRSGDPRPLMDSVVPRWVAEFAAEASAEIAATLRERLRVIVAAQLRAAIQRRTAARSAMRLQLARSIRASRLRTAIASRLGA